LHKIELQKLQQSELKNKKVLNHFMLLFSKG